MILNKAIFRSLLQDESGQNLIEYALIAGLVGVVAVVSMTTIGTKVNAIFTSIGTTLTNAA